MADERIDPFGLNVRSHNQEWNLDEIGRGRVPMLKVPAELAHAFPVIGRQ